MASSLQVAQLSPQLHHMRDVMRTHWGTRYGAKVTEWQSAIANVADCRHIQPLGAAIQLAKSAGDNRFALLAAMAAYVEMVEPSDDANPVGFAA